MALQFITEAEFEKDPSKYNGGLNYQITPNNAQVFADQGYYTHKDSTGNTKFTLVDSKGGSATVNASNLQDALKVATTKFGNREFLAGQAFYSNPDEASDIKTPGNRLVDGEIQQTGNDLVRQRDGTVYSKSGGQVVAQDTGAQGSSSKTANQQTASSTTTPQAPTQQAGATNSPETQGAVQMAPSVTTPQQQQQSIPEYVSFDTANGKAFFRQTEQGLAAVNDPSIIRGLETGQIPATGAGSAPTAPDSFASVVSSQAGPTLAAQKAYSGVSNTFDLPPAPLAQESFLNDPVSFIGNMMNQIYTMMGMDQANTQIDKISKDLEKIENDKDREIRNINDDPWLTEQQRVLRVRKAEDKWNDQINNRINRLQLLETTRNNAQQQAQFALGTAINLFDSERTFQAQQVQAYYDRAQAEFDNKIKLQQLAMAEEAANRPSGEMGDWLFQVENGQTNLSYFDWVRQLTSASTKPTVSIEGLNKLGFDSLEADIPSFDEWAKVNGGKGYAMQSLSPAQMAKLREEYSGEVELLKRAAAVNAVSPLAADIIKTPELYYTITPSRREDVLEELASVGIDTSKIKEGKKQKLTATQSDDFVQAQLARRNVVELYDMLKEVPGTGPIAGRIKRLDPYSPEVAAIKAQINRTVPGLARGVFKEVGVLTDTDVNRYSQTLANLNFTDEQIERLHQDTLSLIDESLNLSFDTYSALGYDLGKFNIEESDGVGGSGQTYISPSGNSYNLPN